MLSRMGLGLGGLTRGQGVGVRPIDLFVIVGQSNAEGRGDSALSPAAPNGRYISGSTITSPLADPVGGATTGSMWPAFSNEWLVQTGHLSAFVEQATGGTALVTSAVGSNWGANGSLRGTAVTAANSAIAAIEANPAYELGSVYFIWAQGEQDAVAIDGVTVTGALYEQALEDLAAYFKTQIPTMAEMLVVQTGRELAEAGADAANYAEIRAAQEAACTDSAVLRMVYRGAFSFAARSMMTDNLHYSQAGNNIAGKCAAREAAVGPSAALTAPTVLAGTPYEDSSYTATSGRAANHTTAAGTKALAVAVSYMRPQANNTFLISATFGGVAMTKVVEGVGANASPTARANAAIFYIDESIFGGSLDAVTASLSITSTLSGNVIDWYVLDLDAECVPGAAYTASITSTTGTVTSIDVTTNAPAVVVQIAAACSVSASVLTATVVGTSEAMDHGLGNGSQAGQTAVGYSTEAASILNETHSITWSASCVAVGHAVVAFRKKISGE